MSTAPIYNNKVMVALIILAVIAGCTPRVYVDTFTDQALNPGAIKGVAIVLDDIRVTEEYNLLFADTFLKTAMAKKKLPLSRKRYILKKDLSGAKPFKDTDAYLEIALTHCYPGNRNGNFPTSVGAVARLTDTKTQGVLWQMNYAYASPKSGAAAPMIEEVMRQVSEKVIDAVPLASKKTAYAAYTIDGSTENPEMTDRKITVDRHAQQKDASQPLRARLSGDGTAKPGNASGTSKSPLSIKNRAPKAERPLGSSSPAGRKTAGAYLVHVASVKKRRLAEQFIDIQPSDGTLRLSTTVQLNPDKLWYRLLVGRFRTLQESRQYIQAMKQNGRPGVYAKPMRLPYSLMISTGRPFEPSQKIVEALRKIDYMAYLSPSARAANAYDVLVGAYENKETADKRAQLLLTNGIPVQVVTP